MQASTILLIDVVSPVFSLSNKHKVPASGRKAGGYGTFQGTEKVGTGCRMEGFKGMERTADHPTESVPKGRDNLEPGTGVPGRISSKSSPEGTTQWGVLRQTL
jgi:hypothetical protein